jgi:hypothetical protein
MTEIAIIGAGPYGLSVAAHLKRKGIPFRIFGRPMDSWLRHMPKGMLLKSDGFASTVSDPEESFTLKHFCAERGIEYADLGTPVKLETFAAFGLAFKDRFLPELVFSCNWIAERLSWPGEWCWRWESPISRLPLLTWRNCRRNLSLIALPTTTSNDSEAGALWSWAAVLPRLIWQRYSPRTERMFSYWRGRRN